MSRSDSCKMTRRCHAPCSAVLLVAWAPHHPQDEPFTRAWHGWGRGRKIQARRQAAVLRAPCSLLRAPRVLQELVIQVCHLPTGERNFTFSNCLFPAWKTILFKNSRSILSHFKLNVLLISIFTFKKIFPNIFLNLVWKPEMAIYLKTPQLQWQSYTLSIGWKLVCFVNVITETRPRVFAQWAEVTAGTGETGTLLLLCFYCSRALKGLKAKEIKSEWGETRFPLIASVLCRIKLKCDAGIFISNIL